MDDSAVMADAVSAQLSNAEVELNELRYAFSTFCQNVQETRTLATWFINEWQSVWNERTPADTVDFAIRTIASSIETLQDSFDAAVGGAAISWDVWWDLAKSTERGMGATTQYNNTYGTVGGTVTVVAGTGRQGLADTLEKAKEALPSEGKLWLVAFAFIAMLLLILFIKLS